MSFLDTIVRNAGCKPTFLTFNVALAREICDFVPKVYVFWIFFDFFGENRAIWGLNFLTFIGYEVERPLPPFHRTTRPPLARLLQ